MLDEVWLGWLFVLSIVMFLAGIALLPAIVIAIPADYFTRERHPSTNLFLRHPVFSVLTAVTKNVLGLLLALAGLVMLVTPGQGLLTLLVGLSLMDLPGKRELQLRILRRPPICRTVNEIRRRANRPPLEFPPDDAAAESTGSGTPRASQ